MSVFSIEVKVVLVGIRGYGRNFFDAIVMRNEFNDFNCVAVIQPNISKYSDLEIILASKKIPVYRKLDDFYLDRGYADLVVIASPLQYHYIQCKSALLNGSHVLCEKPVTVDLQEAYLLDDISRRKGLLLAVGYQNSFSQTIHMFKQDVMSGRYGRALCLSTLLLSGRSVAYYSRNAWAGKLKDIEGEKILDGIANNAGSHSIHQMLYLLGDKTDNAANPNAVNIECVHVNNIETYDVIAMKISTNECSDISFYGSHAYMGKPITAYRYVWEKGWSEGDFMQSDELIVHTDKQDISYGNVNADILAPIRWTVSAIRSSQDVPCGVHSALAQVSCIEGLHTAILDIPPVPLNMKIEKTDGLNGQKYLHVPAYNDILMRCFSEGKLPYEIGLKLGNSGRSVAFNKGPHQQWIREIGDQHN